MVIGIGSFGQRILGQISRLYFASDQARQRITKFLCLGLVEETREYDLLPVYKEDGSSLAQINFPQNESTGKRQEFIEALVKSADQIRASMNVNFHEIRTHEDLLQIDLDKRLEKSVNLFIVADLTNPMSVAALLPLTFLLQDVTKHTHNAFGHMLLNVAIIPERKDLDDKEEVGLYSALMNLDQAFTDVSGEVLQDLLDAMRIQEQTPLSFPVFLFDYRKPNDNDVRDMKELELILGNSLISLMLGNIPDMISNGRPLGYIQDKGLYYSSIGATCLIYDPVPLVAECSTRFAHKLLTEGFLAKKYDDGGLAILADQALTRLGTLPEWYIHLLSGTIHSIVVLEGQIPMIIGNTAGLSLSPIDFENIKDTPWKAEVEEFSRKFKEEVLVEIRNELEPRSTRFAVERAEKITQLLGDQIQNPTLYPQCPEMIKRLLDELDEEIIERVEAVQERRKKLNKILDDKELDLDFNEINQLFDQAEDMPSFWVYIPKFLRKPLSIIINLKWGFKNFLKLERWKREVLSKLAEKHASLTEIVILDCIAQAFKEAQNKFKNFRDKIDAFECVLSDTEKSLSRPEDFVMQNQESQPGWDGTFRILAIDSSFAGWAYDEYQKPVKSLVVELLTKEMIFEQWQKITPEELKTRLYEASERVYMPLFDLSLDQVLDTRLSLQRKNLGDPKRVDFDPISPLLRAALPLMRPNFDALGGSEYSTRRHFLIAEEDNTPFIQPLLEAHDVLRFCQVDDRYIIAAVTIRDLMPLAAFTELNQYLLHAYERLGSVQKKRLQNVFVPIPKLEGEDLVEKTFVWHFGEPEETLQIVLPIGENRYAQARRETRMQQTEWGQYVLAESTELNYLSACFLNIFLQHPQWNAYDQTSAILGFVQQGIEYAFDKDTTPQEEWPRSPIETLMDQVGDCEDAAILTSAIMCRLGFQMALLMLPGHCALGIAGVEDLPGTYINDPESGRHYYYAEATASGWQIGSLPEEYRSSDINIINIERLIQK